MHGGAPIWETGSYDPESNLTFWGTGNAGPDWDGDARLGDNLYSSSVIALDADTGKLKWHYQFSPHNEFDWDSAQIPVLADLLWKGHPRKVMLWGNRNGMFYVLDRTTGEFLLGKPFVKVTWATGFDAKGRPMVAPNPGNGTRIYPDALGATNWYSPSYSPRTGLFYIPARENSSTNFFKGVSPIRHNDGGVYSAVRAIDPQTGDKVWDYRPGGAPTSAGILTTA